MDSAESVTQQPVLGKSVGDMGRPPTRKNNARIWGIYYITLLYPKWLVHSVQFVKFNLVNDLVQRANKLSHIDILWDRWSVENFEHLNSCPVPLRVYFCIVSRGQINELYWVRIDHKPRKPLNQSRDDQTGSRAKGLLGQGSKNVTACRLPCQNLPRWAWAPGASRLHQFLGVQVEDLRPQGKLQHRVSTRKNTMELGSHASQRGRETSIFR